MIFNTVMFLQAETAPAGGGGGMSMILMMLLLFVVMYFFLIMPQQKKAKKLKEMRKLLAKGDKIVTQGGIFGVIVDVKDDYFLVEIDANVKVRVVKDLVFKDFSEMQNK